MELRRWTAQVRGRQVRQILRGKAVENRFRTAIILGWLRSLEEKQNESPVRKNLEWWAGTRLQIILNSLPWKIQTHWRVSNRFMWLVLHCRKRGRGGRKVYCIFLELLQGCRQKVMKVKGNNRGNIGKGVWYKRY